MDFTSHLARTLGSQMLCSCNTDWDGGADDVAFEQLNSLMQASPCPGLVVWSQEAVHLATAVDKPPLLHDSVL